jgi:hypothetical protein
MAYDAESDKIILFGGYMPNGKILTDTWVFDPSLTTWSEMEVDIRPPKGEGTMAYDAESDQIIFYAGALAKIGYYDLDPASETWAYDYNTNTWANMEPAKAPFGIKGTRMVYDTESDRMLLFGGWNPQGGKEGFSETWAYDYNTNTWEKMAPAVSPPGRYYHAMVYDAGADRIILWGGHGESGLFQVDVSIVWTYDYNTDSWEALESSEAPIGGKFAEMVYDSIADRSLLYIEKELWAFDYSTNLWTLLSDSPAPGMSELHNLVYSEKHNQITMFGICPQYSCKNKTWILDCSTDTWTDVTIR